MSAEADLRVEHALFVRSIFTVRPPTRVVSQLAARMRDHTYRRGDTIFERGQPSHAVYFVVDGVVELEAPGESPWAFERGSMIGIGDATLARPHVRTARATTPAHLVSIEFEDYVDILEDNFEYTKTMLEATMAGIHEQALALAPDGVFAPHDLRGVAPLPVKVGEDVDEMRCLLALRDVRALSVAPVQPLVTLARTCEVRHLEPEARLFGAGEPATALFVVAAGAVELTHAQYRATFETGALVGAHAAIGYREHPHRAVAAAPTTVLVLQKEDVYDVMEDHFGLARRLFGWLAEENERARVALAGRAT